MKPQVNILSDTTSETESNFGAVKNSKKTQMADKSKAKAKKAIDEGSLDRIPEDTLKLQQTKLRNQRVQ